MMLYLLPIYYIILYIFYVNRSGLATPSGRLASGSGTPFNERKFSANELFIDVFDDEQKDSAESSAVDSASYAGFSSRFVDSPTKQVVIIA